MPIARSTRSGVVDRAIGLPAPTAAGYPLSHELTDFHFAHLVTASMSGMSSMSMRKVCEVKLRALLRRVMTLSRGRLVRRQALQVTGCLNCQAARRSENGSPGALDTTRPSGDDRAIGVLAASSGLA
jgi:hypothetical protein